MRVFCILGLHEECNKRLGHSHGYVQIFSLLNTNMTPGSLLCNQALSIQDAPVACQSGSCAGMAQAGSAGQCLHSNFSTHLDHLV